MRDSAHLLRLKNATNRDNGFFATGDLYEKHKTIPNAWRYFGRADDLLVLVSAALAPIDLVLIIVSLQLNGEKLSPTSMEQAFKADPRVNECLIFGQNRPSLCCLIFPSTQHEQNNRKELLELLQPTISKINASTPSFGHLSTDMITFVSDAYQLPKTSKGTVQKKKADQVYSALIEKLYAPGTDEESNSRSRFDRSKLLEHLRSLVCASSNLKSENLQDDSDLFALGINSLQAARIRSQIKATVDLSGRDLASNVVFEHSTLSS